MAVIAVAGGTGGVGRAIVEALKAADDYKVIVLGRKIPEDCDLGVPFFAVDYSDVSATAELLAREHVDTVVSTMSIVDVASSLHQLNLIKAAAQSESTRRFIPTEWGHLHPPNSPVYAIKESAVAELRSTDLEWTRFMTGFFMDYFGMPYIKTNLKPLTLVVDTMHKTAAIPGTGDEIVVFTSTADVGRFVVALLGLSKWDEITYCYGERATFNSILRLAEEARGSKFSVTYDSVEKLKKGEVTELPSHTESYEYMPKPLLQRLFSLFELWMAEGDCDVQPHESLNAKFPDIQTTTFKDVLSHWKGH